MKITVGYLRKVLNRALDDLDAFKDDDVVSTRSNTYNLSIPYISTSDGFVSLNNINIEDDEDDWDDEYQLNDSKISFKHLKKHLVKEAKSFKRELFELLEDWIDKQNREDNPEFDNEHIIAYAKGRSFPDYDIMVNGMLEEYKDIASPELINALELSLVKSPSAFTAEFYDSFDDAVSVIASSLNYDN